MDLKQECKDALGRADRGLTSLAEIVTTRGWAKYLILALFVLVATIVAMASCAG